MKKTNKEIFALFIAGSFRSAHNSEEKAIDAAMIAGEELAKTDRSPCRVISENIAQQMGSNQGPGMYNLQMLPPKICEIKEIEPNRWVYSNFKPYISIIRMIPAVQTALKIG